MESWVEGDGAAAVAMFVSPVVLGGLEREMVPALHDWYRATGHEYQNEGCQRESDGSVTCRYTFENKLSRALGTGPETAYFHLWIGRGRVLSAHDEGGPHGQVWGPFAEWVLSTHPEDVDRMGAFFMGWYPSLDQTSIALWQRYTDEFVASLRPSYGEAEVAQMVGIAESFLGARNDHDIDRALSLLADVVVTVPSVADDMPGLHHLALAFEAERIFGIRYEPFECRPTPVAGARDAFVTCTYLINNKLRQIEGLPPVESSVRLGIREGQINLLSFAWLHVSPYYPAEFASFMNWLGTEHPDSVMQVYRIESPHTYALNLTRESLDLLAGYLEEYERSFDS